MKSRKRFVVVEVEGQFYEIERPYGVDLFCVMVAWGEDGKPERVWAEVVA